MLHAILEALIHLRHRAFGKMIRRLKSGLHSWQRQLLRRRQLWRWLLLRLMRRQLQQWHRRQLQHRQRQRDKSGVFYLDVSYKCSSSSCLYYRIKLFIKLN
ncbi:hypothetical protein ACOSP7_010869 [Xanthoceras sorbifolium]